MDFMMFFLWGLHIILLEIDIDYLFWLPLVTKNLGRPTDHLGGPLAHPDDL